MCWLLSSRLCWTYLGRAAEVAASSSSPRSLEKHTLRWLRIPLDTKPSSSSLGQDKLQAEVIKVIPVILDSLFLILW